MSHVSENICEDLPCRICINLFAAHLVCLQVCKSEHGLVVKHFFKMRDKSLTVCGVAVKTIAKLVVDSTQSHLL
ncbi:MAG: hypothetical protein JRI79_12100 [Deltaproteobacteria bacterium]|nr:hypothetical protein [Deltaproteobacteria bacterium]MBW1920074.1 hypothetical protein [Deltaproteobacteria bacterium]MBW1935489.1 hypothetical protein [Deltaproteobacteria bacterium]MBW1978691.1 hypothetical protein [Deltaproteobacteria bacterium]MBW2044188.1 hypothetical protein [Deltaproteobacteria bacterium]